MWYGTNNAIIKDKYTQQYNIAKWLTACHHLNTTLLVDYQWLAMHSY